MWTDKFLFEWKYMIDSNLKIVRSESYSSAQPEKQNSLNIYRIYIDYLRLKTEDWREADLGREG